MLVRYMLFVSTRRLTASLMKSFKSKLSELIVSVRTYEMIGRPGGVPIQMFQLPPAMLATPFRGFEVFNYGVNHDSDCGLRI